MKVQDSDKRALQKGAYIHSVRITHDGSITILVSSSPKEGSVFKAMDSEGNILCRVDSAIIKEAIDVRRLWNARHNRNDNIVFGTLKTPLRTLFDEIGSLPRPNWSFVVINQNPDNLGAEVSLPVEATLSAPHLFVVSGNSLFPSTFIEESARDLTTKVKMQPFSRHINLFSDSSSSDGSSVGSSNDGEESSNSSLESQHTACKPCLLHETMALEKEYPIRFLQNEANKCVSYNILENAMVEIGLQSYRTCQCLKVADKGPRYFGPWIISISKNFIKNLKKTDTEWRKKVKLRGPTWPPDEPYQVKSSRKATCLREGIKKKNIAEVMEYIMDTNTDKFHSESPITVRLAWFMEKQLKNTELVNPAYDWNGDQVVDWLRYTIGLPQYQACFEINGLRGRHLPLLDAERLEDMGIRDFDHILKITSEIRKMFKTQREKNVWREVTEARYDPLTLHAMYNFRSVTKRLPVYDFFINHHFIDRKVPNYSLFELRKPVWDVFPRNVRTAKPIAFFKQEAPSQATQKRSYKIQARW